jgi:hypothetical protein
VEWVHTGGGGNTASDENDGVGLLAIFKSNAFMGGSFSFTELENQFR